MKVFESGVSPDKRFVSLQMEQHLAPYEMECMKMAMLKHEEIFKQQVYELHRLYQIQKMLMKKTSPGSKAAKTNHPSADCFKRYQDDAAIDLTLGLGNYYYSPKISKKLSPTRLTSDSITSFVSSSSSGSSSHSKRVCPAVDNEVEYQEHTIRQDHQAAIEQPPWLFQVLGLNI